VNPTFPALVSYKRAAEMLNVSTKTIQRGVRAGEIPIQQAPGTRGAHGKRIPGWFINRVRARRRRKRGRLT
jgi:predicted site-specific integrase-resolvase